MGVSIKNKVFGSDIPLKVKKKIEARQKLNNITKIINPHGTTI